MRKDRRDSMGRQCKPEACSVPIPERLQEMYDGTMYRFYLSCALGAEQALGRELRHMAFPVEAQGPGFMETRGGLREALFLLRSLRCAERVFVILADEEARDFDQLFEIVHRIPWEDWLHPDQGLTIAKVRVHKSPLASVPAIQSIVQKAAFSRICRSFGLRSVELSGYCHQVRVLSQGNRARILLDLSGDALHMRGWRTRSGVAPLKETVAASMVIMNGWKRKFPLWDAFTGSGTLALEALAFAWNLPSHPSRKFALHRLKIHQNRVDQLLKDELKAGIQRDARVRISASDLDPSMTALAQANLVRLRDLHELDPELASAITGSVRFSTRNALDPWTPSEAMDPSEQGIVLANPPYGERIGDREGVERLYRSLGRIRTGLPGWTLSAITTWDNLDHLMEVRASWVRPVRNGTSEAWVYAFPPFQAGKSGAD